MCFLKPLVSQNIHSCLICNFHQWCFYIRSVCAASQRAIWGPKHESFNDQVDLEVQCGVLCLLRLKNTTVIKKKKKETDQSEKQHVKGELFSSTFGRFYHNKAVTQSVCESSCADGVLSCVPLMGDCVAFAWAAASIRVCLTSRQQIGQRMHV